MKTYIPFLDRKTFDLYSSFRCGLTHSVSPKSKITFSSKEELGHLVQHNGRLNLKVENFYQEFKEACEHVISIKFPNNDKMNVGFLEVPGNFSDIDVFTATGSPTTYTQLP